MTDALVEGLALRPGDRVLDLAAGTGKLTRALLATGLQVEAVEPLERFRAILAGIIGADRAHDGVAEAIPFPDAAFAAVTVSDAFHWFDQPAALAEIRRVLRPGGGLALLAVMPELDDAVVRVIEDARGPHPYFDGPDWADTIAAAPGWATPRRLVAESRQTLVLTDYVATFSWVSALRDDRRSAVVQGVRELAGDQPVEVPVRTVIHLSARD